MLLDSLKLPEGLADLSYQQLDQLAAELRERIVEVVGHAGGHLGSNLGVVELSLALHRVFDSPRDAILWDTGHQAYVHKMLTGRLKDFDKLRQEGGLSGYPSRSESRHDWFENSHASTVLGYAHGLAVARSAGASPAGSDPTQNDPARSDPDSRVVAVIGDGALTGGMAYEGLNNLGHSGKNVIIVFNDNGRSYAPTVSRLSESLIHIRSNPTYMQRQRRLEEMAEKIPWVGELLHRGIVASKAAIREMWEPTAFFEMLGIHYLGPFDGHDLPALERELANAREFPGAVVLHVLTQKGRGHAPAENDPIKAMHDTSELKVGSYTEAFSKWLVRAGEQRPELMAITAAMPDSTGLLPFKDRFPDRFLDVGIAEQHAVTAAAGMAMGGLKPVVAIYSTFLTRAIDQVNLDVGLHRLPVVFCLDRAGVTGDDGPSHHGLLDMVLLSKVPGMTILAPSSYQELEQMLDDSLEITDGPVAIRWAKTAAPVAGAGEVGRGLDARRVRAGSQVCIVGVGKMLAAALEAAEILAADGLKATVWDPRVVKPLNDELLADAAGHSLVVTIEDGFKEGGAGTAVREALAALSSEAKVVVLGVPVEYIAHGKPDDILARLGLDGAGIAATVRAESKGVIPPRAAAG